jgi:hypothetical protein
MKKERKKGTQQLTLKPVKIRGENMFSASRQRDIPDKRAGGGFTKVNPEGFLTLEPKWLKDSLKIGQDIAKEEGPEFNESEGEEFLCDILEFLLHGGHPIFQQFLEVC